MNPSGGSGGSGRGSDGGSSICVAEEPASCIPTHGSLPQPTPPTRNGTNNTAPTMLLLMLAPATQKTLHKYNLGTIQTFSGI